ncbi:dihydrofolate reductase family protein [Nocardia sp. NPDC057353]|uniref:dihydrofolate reductase family protein n=1 Tax=Nocardia sp. NPDC057353 TaxID=3346104 RepID=UPI00362D0A0E
MTTTRFYTATSLDGYIADPENSLEWLFAVPGASTAEEDTAELIAKTGAMCMGATTYEWMLEHDEPGQWEQAYGDRPCWVFTHRELPALPGANLRFVADDVRAAHADMVAAAGGQDIWVIGGGDLAGQFADAGLLDEVVAAVAPVTLGGGAPLLPRRLLSDRLTLTGVEQVEQFAVLTYRVG